MRDLDHHLARDGLRVGQRLQHVVDGPAGDAGFLERSQPVFGGSGFEPRRQQSFQFLQMPHSVGTGRKPRILRQFGCVKYFERATPVFLIGAADHDPFV